jgi:hypothetical protein
MMTVASVDNGESTNTCSRGYVLVGEFVQEVEERLRPTDAERGDDQFAPRRFGGAHRVGERGFHRTARVDAVVVTPSAVGTFR